MFDVVRRFFVTWRFPVVAISLIVSYVAFLVAVLLAPGTAGSFAEDFKIWCFGYDPTSGSIEWAYVWMFVIQPLILSTFIAAVWWRSFTAGLAGEGRRMLIYTGVGVATALVLGVGLVTVTSPDEAAAQQTFQLDQLRIDHAAAPFELSDQTGQPLSLEDLRDRVVLLTAVYTRCAHTCPMTMEQVKRASAALSEAQRRDLRVVILTLDPDHDSPDVLAKLAATHGVSAPRYRLLSGHGAAVNVVLDAYEFARQVDTESGTINHSNLAVLIDRRGRVAFRLAAVPSQEQMLIEALRLLLDESMAT